MSVYQTQGFRIVGISPLLMHNGQLADPLNPFSQTLAELTSKRLKTEADHIEVGRREFFGSLYTYQGRICLPAQMIEAMMIKAATTARMGTAAKAGIRVDNHATFEYDGPTDPEKLWDEERFRFRIGARLNGKKMIQRTRPRFDEWAATFEVIFNTGLLNPKRVRDFVNLAGEQIGLGDWRPKFGRFEVA